LALRVMPEALRVRQRRTLHHSKRHAREVVGIDLRLHIPSIAV
jgi:hypothetical protein